MALPLAKSGMHLCLKHLIENAISNGARAMRLEAQPGALLVVDDGPGISPGNRPHVFDPFFTTRRDSGGTGRGLAIVASRLAAHGGSIALVTPPEGWHGAAFLIRFA